MSTLAYTLLAASGGGGGSKFFAGFINSNGNYPDRKSTRLNSSHSQQSRMPSSA